MAATSKVGGVNMVWNGKKWVKVKIDKEDKLYIKEMDVWLKQQNEHKRDCLQSIDIFKSLITLETNQLKIKALRRTLGLVKYNKWRKNKGLKPIK